MIDAFLAWATARGVAPDQLGAYRQAAQLILSEAAGGRIWPRHVDAVVRRQESGGANAQALATLHKVGDALVQYQIEIAPAPVPAPVPAVTRAAPAAPTAAPSGEAIPGFAPPAADINAPVPGIAGGGDYGDAARALGHYINAILVRIVVAVVMVLVGMGIGMSGNLGSLQSLIIFGTVVSVILTGWQVWALFSYANHSPPMTDSKGSAQAAAVLTVISVLLEIVNVLTSEPSLGRTRLGGGSLIQFLNGLLALIAILLVVSVCRKIAMAFNDGRLEARGRTVNSLIGMSIGGFFLIFILGMAGAGALVLLLALAMLGLGIAAIIVYIMLLYGAKALLASTSARM